MGCNSSYMGATGKEVALSRVACLLEEISGKQINKSHWSGYHPAVYNRQPDGDAMVSSLCYALQDMDVSTFSLEMQLWWRDHQEADKLRLEADQLEANTEEDKNVALGKLTDYEKSLLGV